MKSALIVCVALLFAAGLGFVAHEHLSTASGPVAHVKSEFHFTIKAPAEAATRLFGAIAERSWSKDWDPKFVYPSSAADVQGAVFKVRHGHHASTWVNTIYAPEQGRVQYVATIDGQMLTVIDIHVQAKTDRESEATVSYERTALNPDVSEHVQTLAASDAKSGPHWASAI